jgi:hypothetical protein
MTTSMTTVPRGGKRAGLRTLALAAALFAAPLLGVAAPGTVAAASGDCTTSGS